MFRAEGLGFRFRVQISSVRLGLGAAGILCELVR